MRLRAFLHALSLTHLCASWRKKCESHHSPKNFVDSSTGGDVSPILITGGLWTLDRVALKCMTLHLWAANLKPFLVAHPCIAFTACSIFFYMVSSGCPRKQIARSSTKNSLKMSLAIWEGSSLILCGGVLLEDIRLLPKTNTNLSICYLSLLSLSITCFENMERTIYHQTSLLYVHYFHWFQNSSTFGYICMYTACHRNISWFGHKLEWVAKIVHFYICRGMPKSFPHWHRIII